jgi:hypothetical protein
MHNEHPTRSARDGPGGYIFVADALESPMTNRTDMGSPDALVLTHALEKLRARDGLTSSRLENSRNIESGPLCSDLLGRRRETLLRNWRPLHEGLSLDPTEPPSDRALRGTIEPTVLRELARQLIRREVYSIGSKSVVMPTAHENSSHDW